MTEQFNILLEMTTITMLHVDNPTVWEQVAEENIWSQEGGREWHRLENAA